MKQTTGLITALFVILIAVIIANHSAEIAMRDWVSAAVLSACLGFLFFHSGRKNDPDSHW